MKIIRIITPPPSPIIDFHPDSTLLLPGRPMFLPDFTDNWSGLPHVAVRLNRLGKNISPKFAPRYYDALAPAIRIVPAIAPPDMEGVLSGMDFSIYHGKWMQPDEFFSFTSMTMTSSGGTEGSVEIRTDIPTSIIDDSVAFVSRHTTVKMGDIILLPTDSRGLPLAHRTRITISPDILNLKIV